MPYLLVRLYPSASAHAKTRGADGGRTGARRYRGHETKEHSVSILHVPTCRPRRLSHGVDVSTLIVLLIAVVVVVLVLALSGGIGGRGRTSATSLKRGPRSHTTSRGRPKVAYETRTQAHAQAHAMTLRDGAPMNVYQCDTCAKWHVGHV